jgi:hypothetical protein
MGLYRSTDNGSTFELRADSPNLLGYDADGGDPRSQAWYDLCIAADPKDAEVVYVGAINIWKSEDGGENWTINAHWLGTNAPAVHADQHDLVFSPVDGRLYSAHDGGVHYTSNGGANWNEITNGLAIAQVYKIGQSKQTKDLIMNGYQDNGTSVASGLDDFTTVIGGDGMECAIDHIDETYRYGSLYYGDIRRSTGSYYYSVRNESSQNGIDEDGGWVTPYKLDHQNPNIMYAGFKNIWRSENIKTTDVSDIEWEKLTNHTSGNIVDLEQSPADLNTLYYSKYASFYRIDNLQNGTMSIENLSSNLPITSTPTDILTHPDKKDVVYISIYKSVYRSDDRGQSWTDITGNLPDTYMNCLDLDTLSGGLFAGTYLGVYYRDTSTNEWVSYNKDFPAVDVRELEIFYDTEVPGNSSLRAATYGRGLWKSPLMTPAISDFRVVGKTHKDVTLGWSLNAFEDSVILAYSEDSIIGNLQDSVSYNRGDTIAGGGNILFVGNDSVSYIHKGLLPYTNYYYKIWTWHKGAYVSELAVIAKTEKIPAPRNFTITNIQKNNLDINWNLNEYGDSVLLLYSRQNVFEEPVQDSVYQTGQTLEGGGTLIYQGNASSFEHAGLKELAKYYYRIWSIKQGFYSDGITISGKTACETPATQVSGIAADVLTNNSISLTWNRGNGDKVLVVGRMGTQINNEPESGLVYSGNQIFGEGTSLGNNTYALYNGTGNELIIDSLDAYQDYSFAAYEYMEGNACYLIPGNQNSFKTQKNSLQFLVTDRESETPLYNAAVWVDTLQKNTDMQGLAEFELTNGSYEYVVEAENYLSDTGEFNIKNTNKTFRAPLSPIVTSVNEAEFNEDGIIVFPNPTTGLVNVITKQKQRDVHIKIVGVDGKLIYSRVFDYFSDIQIDLNTYPRGSYFIYVKTKQGVVVKLLIYRK